VLLLSAVRYEHKSSGERYRVDHLMVELAFLQSRKHLSYGSICSLWALALPPDELPHVVPAESGVEIYKTLDTMLKLVSTLVLKNVIKYESNLRLYRRPTPVGSVFSLLFFPSKTTDIILRVKPSHGASGERLL